MKLEEKATLDDEILVRPPAELVFVVDDDRGMRETVIEILAIAGIVANGAGSAASAREKIDELNPTLILVDQRLPDASGIELAAELKRQDPDRPVVLLTGYATMENAIAAVGTVDDFLTKPIKPDQLVKAIRGGIEKFKLRQENRRLLDKVQQANGALQASIEKRTHELAGLVTMAESIARSLGVSDVAEASVKTLYEVSGAHSVALYLCDDDSGPPPMLHTTHGKSWLFPDVFPDIVPANVSRVSLQAAGRKAGGVLLVEPVNASGSFLDTVGAQIALAVQNAQRFERERETVERLSELSRMESTFLASVSHELRTPLTAVIGFAQMLKANAANLTPEEQDEMVDHIISQGRRLNRLVNDILDATRLNSRRFTVERRIVQLDTAIERSVSQFMDGTHQIMLDVEPDLPLVLGDPERIEQIVGNLVQNAIKYSGKGTTVEVSAGHVGAEVYVAVTDHGVGIDPQFVPRVFDSFTQEQNETAGTKRDSGLGLGLYITKGLVDAMGGTIEVESTVGEGTTFRVGFDRSDGGDLHLPPSGT